MIFRSSIFSMMLLSGVSCSSQPLQLAKNGTSVYSICLPEHPLRTETRAAAVFQDYFHRVTGVRLPIVNETDQDGFKPGIFIGKTDLSEQSKEMGLLKGDGFIICTAQKHIVIAGNGTKGTIYGVYFFIEKYLGCRKWDANTAIVKKQTLLSVPQTIKITEEPKLSYREIYLPPAFDDEYLDWHRLQRFEILWGLWGHSFFKLVPPDKYFSSHPEYFSLTGGERRPVQLCLSNPEVLKIAFDNLSERIAEDNEVVYWSVSPNDGGGYCECVDCKKLDAVDGGPQGSLIHFVNTLAANFPDKKITTLAYGYSAHAPTTTRPAENVVVILSSIDAARSKPLNIEPTAASFRKNLAAWKMVTDNIFIWDYCSQFTNYLTPFPVTDNFQPDIDFFIGQSIQGVFSQGSGDTYSDMAELKTYLLAKLLWDPSADKDSIINDFMLGYYGRAAPVIAAYLSLLKMNVNRSKASLDIYGNPISDHRGYLSAENMDKYSSLMDKAEQLTENDELSLSHVRTLRLTQEYVYLQQSKYLGKDQHGLFVHNDMGEPILRKGMQERIANFTRQCKTAGVTELSENGPSPDNYKEQWKEILGVISRKNLASEAVCRLKYPYSSEYPNKHERTLTDETIGYEDYSYNWLCFYGDPLIADMDLRSIKNVNLISINFLEDARHWIFKPSDVQLLVSKDGIAYETLTSLTRNTHKKQTGVQFHTFSFRVDRDIRFIKVSAGNWPTLPDGYYHKSKKATIACDEIWVE